VSVDRQGAGISSAPVGVFSPRGELFPRIRWARATHLLTTDGFRPIGSG
jgi:hypothetical protein